MSSYPATYPATYYYTPYIPAGLADMMSYVPTTEIIAKLIALGLDEEARRLQRYYDFIESTNTASVLKSIDQNIFAVSTIVGVKTPTFSVTST